MDAFVWVDQGGGASRLCGIWDTELAVGETVTFANSDAFAQTVSSKSSQEFEFESGEFAGGETFDLTFDEAGEFAYFCKIHPTMKGTVTAT